MGVLRDRRVAVLLVLVLLGSALSVALALTRPDAARVAGPPAVTGSAGTAYRPADLVGPAGDALAAAVEAVPATLGYDHRDLGASLAAATSHMTAAYAAVFTQAFDARVRPLARQRASVARGVVRGAGIVRTDADTTAICLLYVDQLLVEARGMSPEAPPRVLSSSRVRVRMVLRDGAWKIDGITAV